MVPTQSMQELLLVTDYAPQAMKVMTQALGNVHISVPEAPPVVRPDGNAGSEKVHCLEAHIFSGDTFKQASFGSFVHQRLPQQTWGQGWCCAPLTKCLKGRKILCHGEPCSRTPQEPWLR